MSLYGTPLADSAKQLKEMSMNLERLHALQQHEGWLLIRDYLDSELKTVIGDMARAQSGDAALKTTVAYTILSKIRDLPVEFEKALTASLAQHKK